MNFHIHGDRTAQRPLGAGRRPAGLLLAAVLVGSATTAATATSAHAETRYGGVDMNRACRVQHADAWGAALAEPRNAFSWHCEPTDPDQATDIWFRGINVSWACSEQYGDSAVYAKYDESNFSDPYTWYCVRD